MSRNPFSDARLFWRLSIWFGLCVVSGSQCPAQPIIETWGSSNPRLLISYTEGILHRLEIDNKVEIVVSVHTGPPGLLKGMTIPFYNPDSSDFIKFKVIVDGNVSATRQAIVLAHEMIHIRQYLRWQLVRVNTKDVMWGDKIFTYRYTLNHRSPWEKEAHRMDRTLALLVRAANNSSGKERVTRRLTRYRAEWNRLNIQSGNTTITVADVKGAAPEGQR